MKTNVLIGRFQTDDIHAGYFHIVEQIKKKRKHAKLLILIGEAELSYTNKNPLPFGMRERMVQAAFPDAEIGIIRDCRSDEEWSENLDKILANYKYPVLFGSRDSFIPHYKGKYRTMEIKELEGISSTDRREMIAGLFPTNSRFRQGIIHAVENRFPTAYPTVDIAVLRINHNYTDTLNIELLLGRKPGRDKYCFIGGFVDPTDSSLEAAASRELSEEVPGLMTHEFKYVSSHKVDDFRYKGTKDGVITSLMLTYKLGGSEKAGDDIEEIKWFSLKDFNYENILTPHHHKLFESLKKYLKL